LIHAPARCLLVCSASSAAKHRNDCEKHDAEHLEIVDKRSMSLAVGPVPLNHLLCLRGACARLEPADTNFVCVPFSMFVVRPRCRLDMLGQSPLMHLRPPLNMVVTVAIPTLAADIPRQIDNSSAHIASFPLVRRQTRDTLMRNKQERQAQALQHARAHRVTIVQLQSSPPSTKREEATMMAPNVISRRVTRRAHMASCT